MEKEAFAEQVASSLLFKVYKETACISVFYSFVEIEKLIIPIVTKFAKGNYNNLSITFFQKCIYLSTLS